MRRDDVVAILLDTKNEVKRATDQLDVRVGEVDRDLREALATGLASLRDSDLTPLRTSQQETRTSAYNAGRKANEAITAITELRSRVDQLGASMQDLRADVGEVLQLLRSNEPARDPVPAGGPGGLDLTDPNPSLPTQRPAPAEETSHVPTPSEGQSPVAGEPASAQSLEDTSQEELGNATLPQKQRVDVEDDGEPSIFNQGGLTRAILRASSVASATLVCHRDTWDFVAAQASAHPHFRAPDLEDSGDGLVVAALSGRSLTAALLALHHRAEQPSLSGGDDTDSLARQADWAMASTVYGQIARALKPILPGDGDPLRVVIDDRTPVLADQ